ncbi:MFS transporter [Nocardioides sp. GY 10127]|nr:MFS transporter [Nocardioides sp. GY 10127]
MVAMFAAGIATFVLLYDVQAVLPALRDDFGVGTSAATLAMSLATLGLAAALLVAGPASEALGRTRIIRTSLWVAVVVAVLCACVPSWHWLLALRLLQGVALAGLPAVATAYLREELHHSAQARAAGLYIGGTALGGMAGRLVTAPVAELVGWRGGMLTAAAFSALCALVVVLLLPDSRRFVPTPLDRRRLLALSRAALADRRLRALYLLGATAMGALIGTFNALGFRLVEAPYHLSLGTISVLYLVYALGTVSSTLAGRGADRRGRDAVVPVGLALAVVGVLLVAATPLPVVVVGLACLAMGFFVMHGLASGWVATRAHVIGASPSQAAAFYLCSYYLGSSVFGNLGGTAWEWGGRWGVAGLDLLLLAAAGWAIVTLRRTTPGR